MLCLISVTVIKFLMTRKQMSNWRQVYVCVCLPAGRKTNSKRAVVFKSIFSVLVIMNVLLYVGSRHRYRWVFYQSSISGHHLLSLPFTCPFSLSSRLVFQWGERVRATLLAAVLAIESLHKTEICSGSGQSHNQIKSSQVSCSEAIHSHHKNGSLFVFSVRQSVVGHLAHLRYWDIALLHKSKLSHLSFSVLSL